MQVAILILNWNGAQLLTEYLPKVIQNSHVSAPYSLQIWVIDNASTDSSKQVVEGFQDKVSYLQFDQNYGFAEGYNKAVNEIESDISILLNSDAYPEANWLMPILKQFEVKPSLGAVMPKIRAIREANAFEYAGAAGGFIDVFGYPYCRGRVRDKVEVDSGQYNSIIPVLWASGAALVVKREVYLFCGGLDGDFFAHMEEIDLCWRIWRNGYTIECVPESTVYHLGGASLQHSNPKKTYLNFRNNLAMLWKNWSTSELIFKFVPRLLLDGLIGVIWIFQGKAKHTWAIVLGHNHFFRNIGKWSTKRKALSHLPYDLPKGLKSGSVFLK